MSDPKPRRFLVWAFVSKEEMEVEMPADATDEACEKACADALDNLIGNGDTGWHEITDDEVEE